MKKKTGLTVILMSQILSFGIAQAIQLQNPGFEDNPPLNNHNNVGHSIAPWVVVSGFNSNVVKEDGDVNITGYGSNGPHQDASGSTAGTERHYLDLLSLGQFYQSFTSDCTGNIELGGFFSTRGNSPGTARVILYEGVGTGGNLVGQSTTVNLPGGTSASDPWTQVSTTLPVQTGTVYSFVVNMNNSTNFDEAFINQPNCLTTPLVPHAVPTLSQWSIFLLSLLLGWVAVFSSKKRSISDLD